MLRASLIGEDLSARRRWFPFEFGSFGPLLIRREAISWNLSSPVRLLYASDLHLGHWWTRPVPDQLLAAASATRPTLILLGGDLLDSLSATTELERCVASLGELAPVHAIPGNHDGRVGLSHVRTAVEKAGGHWLPGQPLHSPLEIDGEVTVTPGHPRILCAHYPSVFPHAVQAGYRLVLAGHLHGGQCVLATWRERLYPAVWFHRWHGLRFFEEQTCMLVSRGVADTFPFRFNCPREVILCEIS